MLRVLLTQLVQHTAGQPEPDGGQRDRRLVHLVRPVGRGSEVAPGSTTASGYSLRILRTSGSADSRIEKMCSGPARKSASALFWIATVEYSRHIRCLMVAFNELASRP